MAFVMVCWLLAMISGLSWACWSTGLFTAATLLAWGWAQWTSLGHWAVWGQGVVLGSTPWWLAAQRTRDARLLRRLHAEEAVHMTRLAETARSLLALQASTKETEGRIAEITDVYHVTKATVGTLRLPALFTALLEVSSRMLGAHGLRLIDLSEPAPSVLRARRTDDGRLVIAAQPTEASDASAVAGSSVAASHELSDLEADMVSRVRATIRAEGSGSLRGVVTLPQGATGVLWAPLWQDRTPLGVLIADELPAEQAKTFSMVADQLALQLSRIQLYHRVETLAVTDALTGLFVRRYFLERAGEELSRSRRHGLSCVLLMIDLDEFKRKNDTFGHLVGDVVLRDVAHLLQRHLREIDLLARYGGEEFILLLVETTVEQALPIAERLRQLVELQPIRAYDEQLTQTISIGLAGFPEHAQTVEELIERADQALYAAKRAGRNRLIQWSERLTVV